MLYLQKYSPHLWTIGTGARCFGAAIRRRETASLAAFPRNINLSFQCTSSADILMEGMMIKKRTYQTETTALVATRSHNALQSGQQDQRQEMNDLRKMHSWWTSLRKMMGLFILFFKKAHVMHIKVYLWCHPWWRMSIISPCLHGNAFILSHHQNLIEKHISNLYKKTLKKQGR